MTIKGRSMIMRKFLLFLVLLLTFCFSDSLAQSQYETTYYETIEFAYKEKTDNGTWTDWSDWEESQLIMCWVNNDSTDIFIINSETTQIYTVFEYCEEVTDIEGGKQLILKAKDQNNGICEIRYRIDEYSLVGISQLYIIYNNVKVVYNIRKISEKYP